MLIKLDHNGEIIFNISIFSYFFPKKSTYVWFLKHFISRKHLSYLSIFWYNTSTQVGSIFFTYSLRKRILAFFVLCYTSKRRIKHSVIIQWNAYNVKVIVTCARKSEKSINIRSCIFQSTWYFFLLSLWLENFLSHLFWWNNIMANEYSRNLCRNRIDYVDMAPLVRL